MLTPPTLAPHRLAVALVHPQIAPNTGNVARLCVTVGAELHLIRPLGFILTDTKLRRSAMDYWARLKLHVHDDLAAFKQSTAGRRLWLCENGAATSIWDAPFADGDVLVFGSESAGLPKAFCDRHADRLIGIPQVAGERCLNVSTAAGVVLLEALRQINAG